MTDERENVGDPEGLEKLIRQLRTVSEDPRPDLGFDMRWGYSGRMYSDHPCGSACCIGGHASAILHDEGSGRNAPHHDFGLLCGVSSKVADAVCFPPTLSDARNATPAQAVRLLEILRDEGVVDWTRAMATP